MPRDKQSNGPGSADRDQDPDAIRRRREEACRCVWKTDGRKCYMLGTLSPDVGGSTNTYGQATSPKCFCAYHYASLQGRASWKDTRGFTSWLELHLQTYRPEVYAGDWSRNSINALWDAVCGRTPLPAPRQPSAQGAERATQEDVLEAYRGLVDGKRAE